MLTILDMINRSLSYFNVNTKLKNQAYVVVGFFGEFYLFYVAFRLLKNQAYVRGLLFMLAFAALMYFVVLNFIYYFTDKKAKFDISPKIEKLLGGPKLTEAERLAHQQGNMNVPANGLFVNDQILPADVAINDHEQANLKRVVKQLIRENILQADYGHRTEKEIVKRSRKEDESTQKLVENQTVPYFELVPTGGRLEIFIGLNRMERLAVGHLTSVGLTDIKSAQEDYHIFLANVFITGGPEKFAGRSDATIEHDRPYELNVKVAYKGKDDK
ncbi:hypothetical protein FC70_GL000904 [Paucilactobacillus oligofermentans DSM 15707 = LMG 22743]|uniref:Uncharacterized protein n=1 Tax=Paucilactobacillus oligofermentans DSM 15707 = LMG 22743 TaxID=1423778 RepID=A0A0R1RF02_9LACO|nr:DUF6681 family protein [Paucilactobacillus oligofermentans]KRL55308.1 hypothetical protein FC70_GL000904 [Paucilactobacillus oligofermentans DSM 15707 = LMG 22743]CUS25701.1 Uncharacterized protein LACOL_0393 [Paucilactobacillus oligofermentans DSM 15707 = LMG 22743]